MPKTLRTLPRRGLHAARAGFTLLELMAVIMIIGLLGAFLLPNITDAFRSAGTSACEANMRELYRMLTSYKAANSGRWPRYEGQRFILAMWKEGEIERSEKNAKRFFCPNLQFEELVPPEEAEDVLEYLTEGWDRIGPQFTSYAGFFTNGDRSLWTKLKNTPSQVTILSDAQISHGNDIVYMTGDGEVHRLKVQELLDAGFLTEQDVEEGYLPLGPDSPIEELRTVSNDL